MSLKNITRIFKCIFPTTLQQANDIDLMSKAEFLHNKYSNDLAPSFPSQLLSFRSSFKCEILKKVSVLDLAKMLMVEYHTISSTYSEICTAFILFLTIPVTVAAAERSFSKLKIIKNYLRSTMGAERLSGLAVLAIENVRARRIDKKLALKRFASSKARKVVL